MANETLSNFLFCRSLKETTFEVANTQKSNNNWKVTNLKFNKNIFLLICTPKCKLSQFILILSATHNTLRLRQHEQQLSTSGMSFVLVIAYEKIGET